MDKFCEQLTPKYKSNLYGVYNTLMIVFAVICGLTLLSALFWVGLISIGLAALFYYLRLREYVEYEYIFTNGDIDIDVVYAAQKRKRLITFDMKNVEIMAPVGSIHLDGASKGKKLEVYPKNTKEQIYKAVARKGADVYEIYFIPKPEFVDLCFRTNPKAVKKQ